MDDLSAIEFEIRRVDVPEAVGAGVTFIVSHSNEILWTPLYTRHRFIQENSGIPWAGIAWGGILTTQGEWVRSSYDFGDAPDQADRDEVARLIRIELLKD